MNEKFQSRILITDDQPEVVEDYLKILSSPDDDKEEAEQIELASLEKALFGEKQSILKPGIQYIIVTANQGEEAINLVKESVINNEPFSVAFMDVRMPPGIDGIHAAANILEVDKNIQIVFVTAYSDYSHEEILKTIKRTDKILFIRKPFDADEIRQLALALSEKWNLDKQVYRKTQELKMTRTIAIRTLAELSEMRDLGTGNHLKSVAEYSKFIASELKKRKEPKWCNYITKEYIEDIGESSVLHDIGKVGIPDHILLKPDKLTDEEYDLMKKHTIIGGDVLTKAVKEVGVQSFLTLGKEIAYYHHEKYNGSGYPKGLQGDQIPLSARIVALADVYDALTSDRPYRKALSHEIAFKIITEEMGEAHFDPVILETFKKVDKRFKKFKEDY